jgi:hypothetical protein
MLSFNRPHYLIPSVRAFISYMTTIEPDIPWTLQILDNGSRPEALANITAELAPLRSLNRVRLVHLEHNLGLSRGFNLLFFNMCASTGAPYILSLEDDWQARSNWSATAPVLQASMQLLQQHDKLLEVWLRDTHVKFRMHLNATWQQQQFTLAGDSSYSSKPWLGLQRPQQQQQQVTLQTLLLTCDPASAPWGGYSNGASLKQVGRLRTLGPMPHIDGEADWSFKSCRNGFQVAYICKHPSSCYDPVRQWHWGLFEHIGLVRVPPAMDARLQRPAAAQPGAEVASPASAAAAGVESLQQLPHVELMSVSLRRTGSSIVVATSAWRQRQVLAGKQQGSTMISSSWASGGVMLVLLIAAVCMAALRRH